MIDAKQFWNRVDDCNPYPTLMELAEKVDCTYTKFRQQRVKKLIPKTEDVYRLSKELNVTMEFLLAGEKSPPIYPERIDKIAKRCNYIASNMQLFLIESILGIDSEYTVVRKDSLNEYGEKHKASGSIA